MKKTLLFLTAFCAVMLFTTCQQTGENQGVFVTGVKLDETALTLEQGNVATLTATVAPANATNRSVTWMTSNSEVATVSDNGMVMAISVGTATITVVTDESKKTAKCAVTVTEPTIPATDVTLNKSTLSLPAGDKETLTATVTPTNATNKTVTWSSDETTVATVDVLTGEVTAVAPGTATITASVGGGTITATCAVTVTAVAVTGVTLNKNELTLAVGRKETLTATVAPTNATNKTVTWSSDKTTVATVDAATGEVTAVAEGTANITATTADGNFHDACAVTVEAAPDYIAVTSITIDDSEDPITIGIGYNITLTASILPVDATDQSIVWSSSAPAVVAIDQTGKVTAYKAGTAVITAKAADNQEATCTIIVPSSEDFALSPSSVTIYMGTTGTKIRTYNSAQTVSWSVSPSGIIDFNSESGFVLPVATGTATITATVNETPYTCVVTVAPADTRTKGTNLVLNGDFEISTGGYAANIGPNWTRTSQDWFMNFYGIAIDQFTWAAGDPQNTNNSFFNAGSNGCAVANFTPTGNANRMRSGQNSTGCYQDISVTPGDYFVSLTFAYRCMTAYQKFGYQTVKILSAGDDGSTTGGMTVFYELPLIASSITNDAASSCNTKNGFEVGVVTTVTGIANIPAGVSKVRFQINQLGLLDSDGQQPAPIFIFDDAVFQPLN